MVKTTLINEVIENIQMTGMQPLNDYFGGIENALAFDTEEIEWQLVDQKNTPAEFHPLTQKALIVKKEGFRELKMTPPTINEGIVRDSYSAKGRKVGELKTKRQGDGNGTNKRITRLLENSEVLQMRRKTNILVQTGEALSIGGITVNKAGDKLYYAVPATQKHTLDWSLAATSRISNLKTMIDIMKDNNRYPTRFLFGADMVESLVLGDDIIEVSNTTDKGVNFMRYEVSEDQIKSGYYRAAKVLVDSKWYDIYVWESTYTDKDKNLQTYYPKTAITLASPGFGGMAFGAINIGNDAKGEVDWVAADFYAEEGVKTSSGNDNPEYKDILKSAPAVIIPDGSMISLADVTVA